MTACIVHMPAEGCYMYAWVEQCATWWVPFLYAMLESMYAGDVTPHSHVAT